MLWTLLVVAAMLAGIWKIWKDRNGVAIEMLDPAFDRSEGHPQARAAQQHLLNQNWQALSNAYRQETPSDRYHLVHALGELAAMEPVERPDQPDSGQLALHAGLMLARAWRYRGNGPGGSISENDARKMFACITEAQDDLESALRAAPNDTTIAALYVRSEMLMGGDRKVLDRLVGAARASNESNLFFACNHINFVSPKWHGSIDEMWREANVYGNARHNAAWLAIPARAHIEEWLFNVAWAQDAEGHVAKMQDEGFLDAIRGLDDLFWDQASKTEMSPSETTFAHNHFAFLLNTLRITDRLAPHLQAMDRRITVLPWGYSNSGAESPTRMITQLRRQAGLPAL